MDITQTEVIPTKRCPRFVHRTVKNGRVKIFGYIYKPQEQHQEYNGELDGTRMTFGLYYGAGRERDIDYLSMWGTTANFYGPGSKWSSPRPEIQNGTLPWIWWERVT